MIERGDKMTAINLFISESIVGSSTQQKELLDRLRELRIPYHLGCDASQNHDTDLHIVSDFDSDEFQNLQTNNCKTIGLMFALQCLSLESPISLNDVRSGMCCSCMRGKTIFPSELPAEQRERVLNIVQCMDGKYTESVSEQVAVVVAASVASKGYQWAVTAKKPVVVFEWILECWKHHSMIATEQFLLPVFSGLEICTTGVRGAATRAQIEDIVVKNGGKFTAELQKKSTTHLVVNCPQGKKYLKAVEWKIPTVGLEWLWGSVQQNVCLPVDAFPVPGAPALATLLPLAMQESDSASWQASDGNGRVDSTVRTSTPPAPVPPAGTASAPALDVGGAVAAPATSASMHFAGCCFWLCGFPLAEEREAKLAVARGGGTCAAMAADFSSVTHIIVHTQNGGDSSVPSLPSLSHAPQLLSSHWLAACVAERRLVAVTEQYRVPMQQQQQQQQQAASCHGGAPCLAAAPDAGTHTAGAAAHSLFSALCFAMDDTIPTHKRLALEALVLEHGGRLLASQQQQQQQQSASSAHPPTHLIVNHGPTPANATTRCHHAAVTVSPHWLLACVRTCQLQEVSSHVLFRPLRCALPLPGFRSVKLCLSLYQGEERELLRHLAAVLGARVTDKLTKLVTHLVCPVAWGDKYTTAQRWGGIHTATSDWLMACVQQQSMVPVLKFTPAEVPVDHCTAALLPSTQMGTAGRTGAVDTFSTQPAASEQEGEVHGREGHGKKDKASGESNKDLDSLLKESEVKEDFAATIEMLIGETTKEPSTSRVSTLESLGSEVLENNFTFVAAKRQRLVPFQAGHHQREAPDSILENVKISGGRVDAIVQDSQLCSQTIGYDLGATECMKLLQHAQHDADLKHERIPSNLHSNTSKQRKNSRRRDSSRQIRTSPNILQGLLKAADGNK